MEKRFNEQPLAVHHVTCPNGITFEFVSRTFATYENGELKDLGMEYVFPPEVPELDEEREAQLRKRISEGTHKDLGCIFCRIQAAVDLGFVEGRVNGDVGELWLDGQLLSRSEKS